MYRSHQSITLSIVRCRKSWRNVSSPSVISELFQEHSITNISEKCSPLYQLTPFQKYFDFFRIPPFHYYDERFRDFSGMLSSDSRWLLPIVETFSSLVQQLRYSPAIQKDIGSDLLSLHIFLVAVKPRNIPIYTSHTLLRNASYYITTGHLHSEIYLGKSTDFDNSVVRTISHTKS